VTRTAAVLAWLAGLGFGLPGAYGAAYLTRHDQVWSFFGYPTYGGGPFESWGLPNLPLQMAFVLVCVAELVCGNLLWMHRPGGRTTSLVLLPFEVFFWFGFALPFGFVMGALRAALTVVPVPPPAPGPGGDRLGD
jgi:hypothetical protein